LQETRPMMLPAAKVRMRISFDMGFGTLMLRRIFE
jgi:hypothetical protein